MIIRQSALLMFRIVSLTVLDKHGDLSSKWLQPQDFFSASCTFMIIQANFPSQETTTSAINFIIRITVRSMIGEKAKTTYGSVSKVLKLNEFFQLVDTKLPAAHDQGNLHNDKFINL